MQLAELTEYFAAEKTGGVLLGAMAAASAALAVYLLVTRSSFMAMAWPLLALALVELAIGVTVAGRNATQVATLENGLRTAPTQTLSVEMQRMNQVNATFRVIKRVELVLIVASAFVALFVPTPSAWASVSLGLLLHASALLVFDTFAHHRALHYTQWLQAYQTQGRPPELSVRAPAQVPVDATQSSS